MRHLNVAFNEPNERNVSIIRIFNLSKSLSVDGKIKMTKLIKYKIRKISVAEVTALPTETTATAQVKALFTAGIQLD